MTEMNTRPFQAIKRRVGALPFLSGIKSVSFIKGNKQLLYKTRLDGLPKACTLLPENEPLSQMPAPIAIPRGISAAKKKGILDKLVPLMGKEKAEFWVSLPIAHTEAHSEVLSAL